MWQGREGAKRLVERKWHGGSRGDGADVLVKDRSAYAWILSVSVREYSDLSRRVTIATCRLAGCHAGVATLLRGRGNVVMGAWQRCYGGVATLLWRRGNVVMGAWQPVGPHLVAGRRLANMTRRLLLFAKRLSVCFFRAAVSISSISSIFPLLSACSHPAPVHPLWPPRISCKFYLVLRGCQLLP